MRQPLNDRKTRLKERRAQKRNDARVDAVRSVLAEPEPGELPWVEIGGHPVVILNNFRSISYTDYVLKFGILR